MPLLINAFSGKLNLDRQQYRVPEADWLDALNITRDAEGDGSDVVVSNVPGNKWVLYSLPFGVNKCIGQYPDKVRNRVYMFIWNDGNYDSILYYDRNLGTITNLITNITDTNGVDVLNFNPSKKINHVDIIYRDDSGDLLLWTDGYNAPREINVTTINNGTYTFIKDSYIELAKRPPLSTPTCVYGSDTTKNSNNLRRTMFRFTVRWQYDDYSYSTYSTYSKVPLPIGFYGSDNDIDNTNNNFITVNYPTGDENVAKVEIGFQYSLGNLWTDILTAVVLDKAALIIPDNDTGQYLFYNDNVYQPVPIAQSQELFDWVPQTADTQALANGSTPVYGAIVEGYNNIPQNELDVTITAENVTNVPPDAPSVPSITVTQIGLATFVFTVGALVTTGTHYKVYIFFNGTPPAETFGVRLVGDYTSLPGDTSTDVAFALYSQFNSYPAVPIIAGSTAGPQWQSNFTYAGAYVFSVQVTPGGGGGSTISTEKTWLWDANYIFGIVYVDEQNRDMPGVTTFTNPTDSANDFAVTTPSFSEDLGQPQTPVISAAINHLPPAGAVKYYWVRRRATYGDFLQYITCDFQDPSDGFYYFCLANIAAYKADNSQFIYADYIPTANSRLKVIVGEGSDSYANIFNQDYLIIGTVIRTLTGGASPGDDKTFLKVKAPTVPPSPVYQPNMLVQPYEPLLNPVTEDGAVFYEWGESYDIITGAGGIRYHQGMDQDQTAVLPATFTWPDGDVYFHQRTMYNSLVGGTFSDTVSVMDANFSDFFASAVNDNGRPQVIETNALRAFLPALVRFGNSYQSDTTINQINRFYFENFDEYDRSNGAIRKMFIEGRQLYCFQEFDIAVVPVLTQVVENISGNPLQANSQTLLNKVMYPYKGKYGIGNVPESFAYGKGAKYGFDNNKGVFWRLSQDGLTALSIVYDCNNFFVINSKNYNNSFNNGYAAPGQVYTGNPTIYSTYNEYTNHAIVAFEEINRYDIDGNLIFHQDPYTITFNEVRSSMEGFESFMSYHPEMMGCLNNLLYTFKNGQFWVHEESAYCNFYGNQYGASIQPIFNGQSGMKKTYISLTEYANTIWPCTEIRTQLNTYPAIPQLSRLVEQDFRFLEGDYNSSFRRDQNSPGGLINGWPLRGNYITIKLQLEQTPDFVFLNAVSVKYINSPLNNS